MAGHAFNPSTEEVEARLLMEFQASQVLHNEMLPKKGDGGGRGAWQVCWCSGKARRKELQARLHYAVNSKTPKDTYQAHPALKLLKEKRGYCSSKAMLLRHKPLP